MRIPFPHQAEAVRRFGTSNRLALFWRMRVGKTLPSIRWAARWPGPRLVVTPLSVVENWSDELSMERQRHVVLHGSSLQKTDGLREVVRDSHCWGITNWESLYSRLQGCTFPSDICLFPWRTVLLDESVRIRNPKALTTKFVLRFLGRDAVAKGILTGLPNPESPLDIVNQFFWLYGSFLGCRNWWQFRAQYFQPPQNESRAWIPKPGTLKAMRDATKKLSSVMTLRDIGLGNKRIVQVRRIELPAKSRTAYQRAIREYALSDTRQTNWRVVVENWLSQICGGFPKESEAPTHLAKYSELQTLLAEEFPRERVVVWFRYVREGLELFSRLKKAGRRCGLIYGDTAAPWRRNLTREFHRGRIDTLLVNAGCGKYGLDWSCASAAIYYSLSPSHDDFAQSQERIENLNRRAPLLFIFLQMSGTVDEKVYYALKHKKHTSRSLVSSVIFDLIKDWREEHGK